MRLLAEEGLHDLLHLGHAGLAAHQDDLVDLRGLEPGVLEGLLHRRHGALHQVVDELLELGPREREVQVLRPRLVGGDERQVDLRLQHRRQLHLGLLGGFLETLQRHGVLGQIDALVPLEFGDQPLHHARIEIIAAQVRIAVGRLDFEDALRQLEHRDVVGAAAQVVDGDLLFLLLVESVGERRCGRLVDDPDHVEPGDLAGVLGGLALRVVEVGGHRDHGLLHLVPQVILCRLAHLLEDHRRDLGRGVALALDLDRGEIVGPRDDLVGHALDLLGHFVHAAAHEALDGEHGILRVGDGLALRHLTDQPLTILGKCHHGGRHPPPLGVGNDDGVAALHHCDDRVGGPEVDPDDLFGHDWNSLS